MVELDGDASGMEESGVDKLREWTSGAVSRGGAAMFVLLLAKKGLCWGWGGWVLDGFRGWVGRSEEGGTLESVRRGSGLGCSAELEPSHRLCSVRKEGLAFICCCSSQNILQRSQHTLPWSFK